MGVATEKPVFHWPLNAACNHYADDIVYTDDAPFTHSDKKALRDFIRNRLLDQSLALDETKDVPFDSSQGTVRIHLAVHPQWRRYKTIEGFLAVEERPVERVEPVTAMLVPVGEATVERAQEGPRFLKFTVILDIGYTQFEAVRKEEQEDRYVFYGPDDAVSTFFLKKAEVLAIITDGTFAERPDKSVKHLIKSLLRKNR